MESDQQLWNAIRQSDANAFKVLYEKYWERLYHVAYQKTRSSQVAEDLVHDVFLDLWNNRNLIKIHSSVAAYITTSLKYKVFRWIDAQVVRRKHAPYLQQQAVNSENTVDHILSFNELYHLIEQGIEHLPPKCQSVFKLSRKEHLSVQEISEQLQLSPNTTQNHINKALRILRQQVDELFLALILMINSFF